VINHPLQRRALTSNTLLLCLLFSALPATLSLPIDPAAAQTSPGLPAETDRLLQQGKEQLEASQLEAAGKTLQQALQRYRQRNNRAGEAAALLYLGLLSEARGNPGQAMEALRRSLALARKLGNRALEGSALGGLGKAYLALGDSATALPFFEQSLQIARETGDRRGEATALRNQGKVYEALAQYDRAVDSLERSLSIVREIGDRRGEVEALIDLGVAYRSRSDVAKAMGFHRLSLGMAREVGDRRLEGSALGNLGMNYFAQGLYREAIDHHLQRLKIAQEIGDRQGEGNAMGNLGNAYRAEGEFAKAIEYQDKRLEITRAIGEKRGEAQALSFLGLVYLSLGNAQKAIDYCEQSLAITEQINDSQTSARTYGYLGTAYYELGNYDKAEQYHQLSLDVARKIRDRRSEGKSLGYLGDTSVVRQRYPEAIQNYEASLSIAQEVKDRRGQGKILGALGNVYLVNGSPARAIEYLQRNLAIAGEINNRQGVGNALHYLGMAFIKAGDFASAERNLKQSITTWVILLRSQLPLLPKSQRQKLSRVFPDRWQLPFSLAQRGEAGTRLALFTRLNRQGLLEDIERQQSLLARKGPQRGLRDRLQRINAQLASTRLPAEQRSRLLADKERLEQLLYRLLPQLKPELVEPEQVARRLPPDGVLVEFQRYRPFDANTIRYGEPHYLALVLQPTGAMRAVALGEASDLEPMIQKALGLAADPKTQPQEAKQQLALVRRRLFDPLLPYLGAARRWIVSPDGEVHRVPLGALPARDADPSGATLGEERQLQVITTGRDLLDEPAAATPPASSVMVMTNPDYDASLARITSVDPDRVSRSQIRSSQGVGNRWAGLTHTQQEGMQVAHRLDTDVISGSQATTTRLQLVRAPRIVHIATHGFFLPDLQEKLDPTGPFQGFTTQELPFQKLEDPLLRSGLVLAGANHPDANPNDDGRLTALEATDLHLEGTQLVTLSACSTGLGSQATGEGVYGLQRALRVAGARSTLLSLWKVDDAATKVFMMNYYTLLQQGAGRAEALREVQQRFRNRTINSQLSEYDWSHPHYWAAWQLSGDGNPLPKGDRSSS
jgi:tetratricopeptide (TPR) repeat protein/CHAT domain-containing protein